MTEYLWKVLYRAGSEQTGSLPLADEVNFFDYAPQEYAGTGFVGDFDNTDDRGEGGELWYFVTNTESAMRAALNADDTVLRFDLVQAA